MTQDLKTQILSGASTLHKIHEKYEERASKTEIVTSAAELLRTGNGRSLRGAITDRFAPVSPLSVGFGAVLDGARGEDNSASVARQQAVGATVVVGGAVASAAASGAGALAGYAGLASAVSTLGGGAATTAIASAAGLTAASGASLTGAAATTALVAAVGGPAIAAVAVVGAVTATGYGVYKAAHWLGGWLFD